MEETEFSERQPDGEGGQSHCLFARRSRFALEKAIKRSQSPLGKVEGMVEKGDGAEGGMEKEEWVHVDLIAVKVLQEDQI